MNILVITYSFQPALTRSQRIQYSGGEPKLHRELPSIIGYEKSLGFEDQVITTTSVLLDCIFEDHVNAGLSRADISIDSLNENKFEALTGRNDLSVILSCIGKSVKHFGRRKIIIVLMKRVIDQIEPFFNFVVI